MSRRAAPSPTRPGGSGFSLVELLVTLALLGVVLALVARSGALLVRPAADTPPPLHRSLGELVRPGFPPATFPDLPALELDDRALTVRRDGVVHRLVAGEAGSGGTWTRDDEGDGHPQQLLFRDLEITLPAPTDSLPRLVLGVEPAIHRTPGGVWVTLSDEAASESSLPKAAWWYPPADRDGAVLDAGSIEVGGLEVGGFDDSVMDSGPRPATPSARIGNRVRLSPPPLAWAAPRLLLVMEGEPVRVSINGVRVELSF